MNNEDRSEPQADGLDRRGFLQCMAWAGSGIVLAMSGGIARSYPLESAGAAQGDFTFVQLSDSHIGFNKAANRDVVGTFRLAVDRIKALETRPDLILHTGDISHLSRPEEFDTVAQVLNGHGMPHAFYVPGEHDVIAENGKLYRETFARGALGDGWYSFDHKGVHFVGLVNVSNLGAGNLGSLGAKQVEWLETDLKSKSSSTPIVVFAHIPLWTVYQDWGWGTEDGGRVLELLKRFGSAAVLNGHIHQVVQKVEGSITFHTACSTAFPQPKPGAAPGPGPMAVPTDELRRRLGMTSVHFRRSSHSLAVIDSTLG